MAQLIVRLKDREMQRVPVTSVATRIGRDDSNEIVIKNDGISRHHATLRYETADGVFVIYDASSSNGLYVRGRPTPYARLADGDEFHLGKFTLLFQSGGGVPVESLAPEVMENPSRPSGGVHNPLPTVAVQVAPRRSGTSSSRPSPFAIGPPTASTPPAPSTASQPPGAHVGSEALELQARMMRQMLWLLVALLIVLCVLVVLLLRR